MQHHQSLNKEHFFAMGRACKKKAFSIKSANLASD
jgi:hypothetical protein